MSITCWSLTWLFYNGHISLELAHLGTKIFSIIFKNEQPKINIKRAKKNQAPPRIPDRKSQTPLGKISIVLRLDKPRQRTI